MLADTEVYVLKHDYVPFFYHSDIESAYKILQCIVVNNYVYTYMYLQVKNGNVTICLRKKEKENWQFLTGREKKLKEAKE